MDQQKFLKYEIYFYKHLTQGRLRPYSRTKNQSKMS